jgi:hypothetical protein
MDSPKIYEDFLPQEQAYQLSSFLESTNIRWEYNTHVVGTKYVEDLQHIKEDPEAWQLVCEMYHGWKGVVDQSIVEMSDLLSTIGPQSIARLKSNLNRKTLDPCKSPWHTDFYPPLKGHTTAIWYSNTNNGYTEFEDGTKIESIANRLVTFPATWKHRGVTCTDALHRIVVNINFAGGNYCVC